MKSWFSACCIFLTVMFSACSMKDSKQSLQELFSDHKEFSMREFPETATYDGDHRYDDKLTDYSEKAIKQRFDSLRVFLQRANDIELTALTGEDSLSLILFRNELSQQLESEQFNLHYMPITQQDGIHIGFPQIIEYQPFKTVEDYDRYANRLSGFSKQVDDIIENMSKGIKAKITLPQYITHQILDQVYPFFMDDVDSLPFMKPLQTFPASFTEKQKARIRSKVKFALDSSIQPAYSNLHMFLLFQYMPESRRIDGIHSLPKGKELYANMIRKETTTGMNPDSIYALGLREVARIDKEMQKVKDELGFKGTVEEFRKQLIKNPSNFYTAKQPMMDEYRRVLSIVDSKLPTLFGRLPKSPYDLKEIESYRAISAPQAYYYSAPLDRSRPGYFYVNTYDLASRPKHTMTALALHEAVPGHHLQIAIAQELPGLPWFRQQLGINAFVEGWALYAESLGHDMGLYQDPYQRFGALAFEMWRACRLVIDAGIHTGKMNREEGVQFMMKYTGNAELDARSEVDRYIVWPAQALSYKLGQLHILDLKKEMKSKLGNRFSQKAFHDAVLAHGPLPLTMLNEQVRKTLLH
ncbi:MAG: DUF885 domain-containing protein [Candidatus Kapaibacteriota bacterium]